MATKSIFIVELKNGYHARDKCISTAILISLSLIWLFDINNVSDYRYFLTFHKVA